MLCHEPCIEDRLHLSSERNRSSINQCFQSFDVVDFEINCDHTVLFARCKLVVLHGSAPFCMQHTGECDASLQDIFRPTEHVLEPYSAMLVHGGPMNDQPEPPDASQLCSEAYHMQATNEVHVVGYDYHHIGPSFMTGIPFVSATSDEEVIIVPGMFSTCRRYKHCPFLRKVLGLVDRCNLEDFGSEN